MFVNFNKVFRKTPQTELKIPKELAEELGKDLPDGFKYVVNNNTIVLLPDEEKDIKISGINPCPTDEQRKALGTDFTFDDLMKLSYNSQTCIPIKLKNGNLVNINGKDIPIEQLQYNPYRPIKVIENSIRIMPPQFPPAFPLSIGCNRATMQLTVTRIPNNSIDVNIFQSDPNSCLSINYSLNSKTNALIMKINIDPKLAKSVKEIVDSYYIYNAFAEGEGILAGIRINAKLDIDETSKFDGTAISFWEKVYELETKLEATFSPPFIGMDFDDICYVEEIYQNIINLVPIRQERKFTSITAKWDYIKDQAVKETVGIPVMFEAEGTSTIELFGAVKHLPCIIFVFNSKLTDYQRNEDTGECTIFLDDISEEKGMYISLLRFLTDKDLADYRIKIKSKIKEFQTAKKRYEFLM